MNMKQQVLIDGLLKEQASVNARLANQQQTITALATTVAELNTVVRQMQSMAITPAVAPRGTGKKKS